MCPDAAIGDTGVVDGITYTKRTKQQKPLHLDKRPF